MATLTGVDSSDANGSSNQFGSEFGVIYKDLTGTDKTKADKEIAKIFYFIHKKMHTKIYEAIQKKRITGKWYELNLSNFSTLKKLAIDKMADMDKYAPFSAGRTDA